MRPVREFFLRFARGIPTLLLFMGIGILVLCFRSFAACDTITRHARFIYPDHEVMHHFSVASLRWRIVIGYTAETSLPQGDEPGPAAWHFQSGAAANPPAYDSAGLGRFGFAVSWSSHRFGPFDALSGWSLMFPHVALVLLLVLPWAGSLLARRVARSWRKKNKSGKE